ncbi:uncharacterized mitochondrial protein AtMg00810-like [Helianthus annuus]|uniref:uncharacterized mitochondrial protein AtMg00810-like n=1 Tax=Helianthus annuus TaxID=4232 RepID=UPI000B8F02A7|nr:uncharacterized mitochondrial protein AtMg00810-like [Helianthus annuus]
MAIHQLDVKDAFLHVHLNGTVFMHQPPDFIDKQFLGFVFRLKKSLYGLKQAPHACHGQDLAYLLLYVDDIVLIASSDRLLHNIIQTLSREFAMSDLGNLHHFFLGIKVTRTKDGLFFYQAQYAKDIISRANMTSCKPCATPVDLSSKLSATDGPLFHDPTLYRSLAGALQYLAFTRLDISYAVQQVCLFMHEPHEPRYAFMKRIIRYIQGTLAYGIRMVKSATTSLVAYSDTDWGGCPDSHRSTSGYCVFLGNNLLSPLNASQLFHVPVQRLNTAVLRMLLLKSIGYETYCLNCMFLFFRRRSSLLIMSLPYICLTIRCSISVRSI